MRWTADPPTDQRLVGRLKPLPQASGHNGPPFRTPPCSTPSNAKPARRRSTASSGCTASARKSVVSGKSLSGRVDLGVCRILKKKKNQLSNSENAYLYVS